MTEATHQIICDEFESLAQQFKKQVSCYGLFSRALPYKKFYGINVSLRNFWEIDTYEDIMKAREIFGQIEEF